MNNLIILTFSERLSDLVFDKKTKQCKTQKQMCKEMGISEAALSKYLNLEKYDKEQPGYDSLIKISDYFDVSIDYLLNRTNFKRPIRDNKENRVMQHFCDYVGLDESAIKILHEYSKEDFFSTTLGYLLSDTELINIFIDYFMTAIYDFFKDDERYKGFDTNVDYKSPEQILSTLVKQLPIKKEEFKNNITNNKKLTNRLVEKFAYLYVDRKSLYSDLGYPTFYDYDEGSMKFMVNIDLDLTFEENEMRLKEFFADDDKLHDKWWNSLTEEEKKEEIERQKIEEIIQYEMMGLYTDEDRRYYKDEKRERMKRCEEFLVWYDSQRKKTK